MPNALPKAHLSTLSTPGAHLWLRLRALAARHLLPSARCYSGRAGASAGADLSARRLTKSSCASANAKDMARSSPRARGSRAGAAHGPAAWPRDAVEPRKPPSRPYLAAWPMNCSWLLWRKRRVLSLLATWLRHQPTSLHAERCRRARLRCPSRSERCPRSAQRLDEAHVHRRALEASLRTRR